MAAKAIVDGLRKDGVLNGPPFSQPIDFVYFDFWHYDGRTAKHGAFMGGADFVQWHGNYPMLRKTAELKAMADDLRRAHGGKK
jgi:hydroxylamine dehydrogenase